MSLSSFDNMGNGFAVRVTHSVKIRQRGLTFGQPMVLAHDSTMSLLLCQVVSLFSSLPPPG